MDYEEEVQTEVSAELKKLTEKALDANKAHQYALTKYAERLTTELQEVEKLMDSVTTDNVDDEPDVEVQIPGAKKAMGPCPISEFLNAESPFFEHASRRSRYLSDTVDHPMKAKELDVLAEAVKSENIRLKAYEAQKSGQDASATFDIENNTKGINWSTVAEKVSNVCTVKRTADQCRIRWLGDRHPRINHANWSSTELEKLKGLVSTQLEANDSKVDWVQVAKDLGTNRTPLDCMRRGLPRQRHTWHPEADERLAEAVKLYGTDNWNIVARFVSEDATAGQCQGRYTRAIDPSRKRGPWADDEFERLKVAVAAYGNSWVEVAACIPGRTNEQCRERWTEHLSLSSANIVWSEADDQALMDAVNTMGNRWTAISTKIGNKATGHQCRARWEKLKRVQEAAAAGSHIIASTSQQGAAPSAVTLRPRGRPRQEGAAFSTGNSETGTTPVLTARPKPRPTGKGKGKEKAVESPSEPSPSISATETIAAAPGGSASILDGDNGGTATKPMKRTANDAEDEVPPRKKRKISNKATGESTRFKKQVPAVALRTSPHKGLKNAGRPRKPLSQGSTTPAMSDRPSHPTDDSVATGGAPTMNPEGVSPPAQRPKPRLKKVVAPLDPKLAAEFPLPTDAFNVLPGSEPESSSIALSPQIAKPETDTATAGKPKPRQRGRPRKVMSLPRVQPECEVETLNTVDCPALDTEEIASNGSMSSTPRGLGRGRGRGRGRGKAHLAATTTGSNGNRSRRQSARVAATGSSAAACARPSDEIEVEEGHTAVEDPDFKLKPSFSDADVNTDGDGADGDGNVDLDEELYALAS